VSRLYARAGRRFLRRHPAQLVLAIAGIALGVAVVVGVDLANDSARRAFELSSALVTGRATHQLVGVDGSLPDGTYARLRRETAIHRAAPVIEATVQLPDLPHRPFTLLGVDPLAEAPIRDEVTHRAEQMDLARLLTVPGTVVLPRPLAEALGAGMGSRFTLQAGGRGSVVEVAGIVDVDEARREIAGNYVFADIATAQELTGLIGHITRIDLALAARDISAIESLKLPGALLLEAESQGSALVEMTRAFRINLQALSLLALVVGTFLIYSTLTFLAVRRRQVAGTALALGVTRGQLFRVMLAEAMMLGAFGTLLGVLLGHFLGAGLTGLVLRTIEDLYFAGASAVRPEAWVYLKGAALGLAATALATIAPALAASRTPPRALQSRAHLERATRRQLPWLAGAAAILAGTAVVLFLLDSRSVVTGFAGLFAVVAAAALLTPSLTAWLLRALEAPADRIGGLPGRLAAGGAAASLSRTGVAVTALALAVATVIGIGVMIESFRGSVADWLDETLQSDFYLRLEQGSATQSSTALDAAAIGSLRKLPGVAGLSLSRSLRLPTESGWIQLRAFEPGPQGWGLRIIEGEPQAALAAFRSGRSVVVSESFARHRGLTVGETLALPAAAGAVTFDVAGIFRDYSSERGAVVMRLDTFRREWSDDSLTGVGIYLRNGADAGALRRQLERFAAASGVLQLAARDKLRAASMRIFERTFTITEVLRWLAGLVAFFGILSALLALELERTREFGVLRAIGFTPSQLRRLVLTQTGILGLVAGLIAIPLGVTLAALLVFVINERAFGWSMAFVISPRILAGGILLALAAALAAGIAPAVRMPRVPLAAALREE
jgi:putative ABC transport system permease protein